MNTSQITIRNASKNHRIVDLSPNQTELLGTLYLKGTQINTENNKPITTA